MLSKNMVATLQTDSWRAASVTRSSRDGRTVRALQTRGLIKYVRWDKHSRVWNWKLTRSGRRIASQLSFLSQDVINSIMR